MKYLGVVVPSPQTLRRYGLSIQDWCRIVHRQGGVCGVCGDLPETGRLVIDHEHTRGWKRMRPEGRKRYVRGLACTTCNHFVLTRYGTPEKFRGAAVYLEEYKAR